jgi:hypothetical protein
MAVTHEAVGETDKQVHQERIAEAERRIDAAIRAANRNAFEVHGVLTLNMDEVYPGITSDFFRDHIRGLYTAVGWKVAQHDQGWPMLKFFVN